MLSSKRIRRSGLPLVLFCASAFLMIQSLSSGSAKVGAPFSRLEQPQSVEAEGNCMLYPLSLEERTGKSRLIVEGKVLSHYSFWDSRHQLIYTSNLIEVYKVFKGSLSATQVEVITEGGTVGNKKHVHNPSLQLSDGEMGVFFCESSRIVDPQSKRSQPSY